MRNNGQSYPSVAGRILEELVEPTFSGEDCDSYAPIPHARTMFAKLEHVKNGNGSSNLVDIE